MPFIARATRGLRAVVSSAVVGCLAAALLFGCSESTGPAEALPADFVQRAIGAGRVNVCSVGPTGSYTYGVSARAEGAAGTLPHGATPSVEVGRCIDLWVTTPSLTGGPEVTVTVTSSQAPSGVRLTRIISAANAATGPQIIGQSVTFRLSSLQGGVVTFYYGVM